MKRRFANAVGGLYYQKRVEEDFFKGYISRLKFQNVENPLMINKKDSAICIKDNNYVWYEVYPDNANYAITIIYDDKGNLVEWYFDIAKAIGIENGIPYEDDLYLDLVVSPTGEGSMLDEDELLDALENKEITADDVRLAYETIKMLEEKYVKNFKSLVEFTDYIKTLF